MISQKISNFVAKNFVYLILSTYLFYMFFFYFAPDYLFFSKKMESGYLLGGDSKRYIIGSEKILNLELPSRKSYIGYMIYIAIFKYFKLNLSHIVISQIFLSFLSSICIYKISSKLSSRIGGIFCLSLYLFYLPIQVWNYYILTETLFICSIIFSLYFLIFFQKKFIPIIILLFIFTISIRPHGIILLLSFFISFIIWTYLRNNFKFFWLSIFIICILSYPSLLILNLYITDQNIEYLIANAGIIWGYKELNSGLEFKMSDTGNGDLNSLLIFLKNNTFVFINSFLKKIWFFLFRIRPHYSDFHNLYLIIFNIIYYPLALYGSIKLIKSKKNLGVILIYMLIISFTFTAGLTFADWDSRFSLYITPLFFILASIGFVEIISLRKKLYKV